VERCHLEKKGLLPYISTKLCCTSTVLNDQESIKLSRNVMMFPSAKELIYSRQWAGNKPTSALSVEAVQCHKETLLPARMIRCEEEQSSAAH